MKTEYWGKHAPNYKNGQWELVPWWKYWILKIRGFHVKRIKIK